MTHVHREPDLYWKSEISRDLLRVDAHVVHCQLYLVTGVLGAVMCVDDQSLMDVL